MNRFSVKMLWIVFLLGVGLFVGFDLASRGLEEVHGPFDGTASSTQTLPPQEALQLQPSMPLYPEQESTAAATAPAVNTPSEQGMLSRTAENAGKILQRSSQTCVEAVVSFFEGLFS
ncbi:hypothetical protein [Marinicrinis lubricantis]|uniref:Uncharacterized protein n=1 Tax=Marinicrinis lubricantis TaxID=2086470 RepID=A0ABW1IUU2_9BACL